MATAQGQVVSAAYACAAPSGATITACSGTTPVGAPINTATVGAHTFTVNAVDSDGVTATRTVTYTVTPTPLVVGPPPPPKWITPSVTGLHQSAAVWREGGQLAQIAAKTRARPRPPVGATFTFTLNEPARVLLRFAQQATTGRKVRNRCLAPTKKTAHNRRCTRAIVAGTVILTGHRGTNHIRFQGRLSRTRKLRLGRYALTITATDANQRSTTSRPLRLTIVK